MMMMMQILGSSCIKCEDTAQAPAIAVSGKSRLYIPDGDVSKNSVNDIMDVHAANGKGGSDNLTAKISGKIVGHGAIN